MSVSDGALLSSPCSLVLQKVCLSSVPLWQPNPRCHLQECAERRMFSQTFPTSPFIYYYDDKYEIREREHRIKRKVKGMLLDFLLHQLCSSSLMSFFAVSSPGEGSLVNTDSGFNNYRRHWNFLVLQKPTPTSQIVCYNLFTINSFLT